MNKPLPCLPCTPQARKRYEADRKAEEEHRRATLGEWVWNQGAGYYYNAVQRWYYDAKTGGGALQAGAQHPPEWACCFVQGSAGS